MRILIVEDSAVDSLLLRNILSHGGYDPTVVGTGEDALGALESYPEISLVLADINMPGMDGIELLETMRKDPSLSAIPLIFVSGVSETETVHRAAALRPDGYVLKPFTEPSKVLDRVNGVARRAAVVVLEKDAVRVRTGLGPPEVKALFARVSQEVSGVLDVASKPEEEAEQALKKMADQIGAQRLLTALTEEKDAGAWSEGGRIRRELQAVLNCVAVHAA